jgi:hexosaminidase
MPLLMAVFLICSFSVFSQERTVNIIPVPVEMKFKPGNFTIDWSTVILIGARDYGLRQAGMFLADALRLAGGPDIPVNGLNAENKAGKGSIILNFSKKRGKLPKEGYILHVTPEQITITADSGAGVFYGVQTLLQLLPPEICKPERMTKGQQWTVPCIAVKDYPQYSYRGMHLDVSRHFFPREFIKKYIDLIAMYKMNTFQWHLTDDQGWRIEIKKYPKLTAVGAWRADREDKPWDQREPQQPGEKATYGGFYTQEDIREIVRYASDRFVTIIPEIEMPAHAVAALAAYPQFSCTGGPFTVMPGSYWPNTAIFCAGNDSTFTFLEDVLSEVMDLFPSQYIHIGGDEADKTEWMKCPDCQSRMKAEGLATPGELQSYFVKRIEKYISSKGRKMIGWDEILEGGLAPEATVMSWRGLEGGIAAAQQGHDAIMTPTSYCYFDYYQADPKTEPLAIGGFVTLKKVYSYEPTPAELTKDQAKHILGAQGNLWTEFIPTTQQAEYMAVPRMLALAEVDWSPSSKRNWNDFNRRLQVQFRRLGYMNVNYSKGSFRVNLSNSYDPKKKELMVTMSSEQYDVPIRYTLDGNDPTIKSTQYTGPVAITKNCYIKAGLFVNDTLREHFTEMPVIVHNAIPAKITYLEDYSYRYPSSGDHALIDGFKGSINHRDGYWQGYLGNNMDVILDLGKMEAIHSINVTCLQNTASWIFLPEYVEFSLSPDGKHWHSINQVETPRDVKPDEAGIQPYAHLFPATEARYVRVTAKNPGVCPAWHEGKGQKSWIFVDEIVVF